MNYFIGTHDRTASISKASDADSGRLRSLRVVLFLVGLIFIFGIYALGVVWPSGWVWGEAGSHSFIPSHYLMMIIGVYATLGVFLIIASRNPVVLAALAPRGGE